MNFRTAVLRKSDDYWVALRLGTNASFVYYRRRRGKCDR